MIKCVRHYVYGCGACEKSLEYTKNKEWQDAVLVLEDEVDRLQNGLDEEKRNVDRLHKKNADLTDEVEHYKEMYQGMRNVVQGYEEEMDMIKRGNGEQ